MVLQVIRLAYQVFKASEEKEQEKTVKKEITGSSNGEIHVYVTSRVHGKILVGVVT